MEVQAAMGTESNISLKKEEEKSSKGKLEFMGEGTTKAIKRGCGKREVGEFRKLKKNS